MDTGLKPMGRWSFYRSYIIGITLLSVIFITLVGDYSNGSERPPLFGTLMLILSLWGFFLVIAAKRSIDLGKSWAYALGTFIPIYGLIVIFKLLFFKGVETQENKNPSSMDFQATDYSVLLNIIFVMSLLFWPAYILKDSIQLKPLVKLPAQIEKHDEYTEGLIEKSSKLCDETIIELAERLIDLKKYELFIKKAQSYFNRCGDRETLRWKTFYTYKMLGQWDLAEKEVSHLIKKDPTDHDYYVWRALMFESLGQHDKAISDFKKALKLTPRLQGVPLNLAHSYAQTGQYCKAKKALRNYRNKYRQLKKDPSFKKKYRFYAGKCRKG